MSLALAFYSLVAEAGTATQIYLDAKKKCGMAEYAACIEKGLEVRRRLGKETPKVEGLLAYAYYNAGNIIEASVHYEKLLRLTPDHVEASQGFRTFRDLGTSIDVALDEAQKGFEKEKRQGKKQRLESATAQVEEELQADVERRKKLLKGQQKDSNWFFKKAKALGTHSALQEVQKHFPKTAAAYRAQSDLARQRRERNEELLKKKHVRSAQPLADSRDGQTYQTIKLGHRIFMAENLNYKMRGSYEAEQPSKGDGRLYTWKAALKACPDGWELPTVYNYATVMAQIGIGYGFQLKVDTEDRLGVLLKSEQGWWGGDAYDSLGFNGRPMGIGELVDAGLFRKRATYSESGRIAAFWTSTETKDKTRALWFELNAGDDDIDYDNRDKKIDLAAVRCMKSGVRVDSDPKTEYQQKVEEGQERFSDGEYRAALTLFEEAISLAPDHWEGYYWKGRIHYQIKDYPATISAYDKAARLNPDHHYTFHNRGLTKRLSGDPEGGIADLRHSLTIEPDSYWAHWQIALAYKNNLNDCRRAIPNFRAALDAIDAETASDAVLENYHTIKSGLNTCLHEGAYLRAE